MLDQSRTKTADRTKGPNVITEFRRKRVLFRPKPISLLRLLPLAILAISCPLYYYRFNLGLPFAVTLTRCALLLALVCPKPSGLPRQRRLPPSSCFALVCAAAFLMFSAVQAARAEVDQATAWRLVGITIEGAILCAVLVSWVRSAELARHAMRCFVLGAVLPTFIAVYQYFQYVSTGVVPRAFLSATVDPYLAYAHDQELQGGLNFTQTGGVVFPRLASSMQDPNWFGIFLAFELLFVFSLSIGRRSPQRALGAAIVALLSVLMFLTLSRSAWFGLLVGASYLIGHHVRRNPAFRKGLVKMAMLLLLAGVGIIYPTLNHYELLEPTGRLIEGRLGSDNVKSGFEQRDHFFSGGWKAFTQNPLIGIGKGNLISYTGFPTAHNFFLTRLGEDGLIGLTLSSCVLLSLWFGLGPACRDSTNGTLQSTAVGLRAALLALASANLFYDHLLNLEINFFVLGLGFAVARLDSIRRSTRIDARRPIVPCTRELRGRRI